MGNRKKKEESAASGDSNMAMTVSLFIIILAFFIMLNSIAVVDESRKRVALGSLMENFGILSGGSTVVEGLEDNVTPSNISQLSGLIDFSEMFKEKDGMAKDLVVTGDRRRSTLSIPEFRLFKPGDTALIPESHALLNQLAEIIKKNKYPVDIVGNINGIDAMPGQQMPPRELSTLQAMALQSFFIQEAKVSPEMLAAYGWGEFRPVASTRTRESRNLNRRVEVVFFHEPKQQEPEGAFVFKDFFFKVFDRKR